MMLKGLHDLEVGHFVVLYVYLALQLDYKSTSMDAVVFSGRKGMVCCHRDTGASNSPSIY